MTDAQPIYRCAILRPSGRGARYGRRPPRTTAIVGIRSDSLAASPIIISGDGRPERKCPYRSRGASRRGRARSDSRARISAVVAGTSPGALLAVARIAPSVVRQGLLEGRAVRKRYACNSRMAYAPHRLTRWHGRSASQVHLAGRPLHFIFTAAEELARDRESAGSSCGFVGRFVESGVAQ